MLCTMLTLLAWLILGTLVGLLVTFVAGRLLGARRGWVALLVSGIVGWTVAVIVAGLVTDWEGSSFAMVAIAVVLGTLFTMSVAILIDLFAPVGSLASGDSAGLVTITNPLTGVRDKIEPLRRYREVIGIARRNGISAAPHRALNCRSGFAARSRRPEASSSSSARSPRRVPTSSLLRNGARN